MAACSAKIAAHVCIVTGRRACTWSAVADGGAVIGRTGAALAEEEDAAELRLDDPWISRRHVRVHHDRGRWQLTDLGGRNRAFVEGKPLEQGATAELDDGAVLRLGDTLLVFRASAPPAPLPRDPYEAAFPGRSALACALRRELQQLARGAGHVLLYGETGTGKERVAQAFGAPDRPFVPQNCAELTRDLARSDLFGHLRGAFSGAIDDRKGLVELARRGVLFLDELGELPQDLQADLLRFLEDGHYRPIGAAELRHSNARVVAATNVDLDAAVRAGRFRRDLLARLRAQNPPLELPPLRQRREDLLDWATRFLVEALADRGLTPPAEAWSSGAAECLLLYPWPANLRELRGAVRQAVARAAAAGAALPLTPEQLPTQLREHRRRLRATTEPVPAGAAAPAPQPSPEPTRDQIEALLAATAGSVRATSTKLGIDRRKLYRLCEKLGIELDRYRANPNEEE